MGVCAIGARQTRYVTSGGGSPYPFEELRPRNNTLLKTNVHTLWWWLVLRSEHDTECLSQHEQTDTIE